MAHILYGSEQEAFDAISLELAHTTALFPEDTDETCTFTCGGTNNVFGAWAEIVDNNAVSLSSKASSYPLHISSILVMLPSVDDVHYLFEIGYDSGATIVTRAIFGAGTKFIAPEQETKIWADQIPAGETIVYRAKCETAGATFMVHFRYHLGT